MTAEELKKIIEFKVISDDDGALVVATLSLRAIVRVDKRQLEATTESARKHLTEQLFHALYADQRRALDEAILEVMTVDPFNLPDLHKARTKLLKAAMFQQPK